MVFQKVFKNFLQFFIYSPEHLCNVSAAEDFSVHKYINVDWCWEANKISHSVGRQNGPPHLGFPTNLEVSDLKWSLLNMYFTDHSSA